MNRLVIAVALALPGLLSGGTVFAGCGCGCRSNACSQPTFTYGQPAFGPGSYRFWDRQNSCWLFYDAATKGTYFWSPAERRYQLILGAAAAAPGGVPTAPSGDDHQHEHGSAAAAAPGGSGHCPNCATRPIAAPGGSSGNPGGAELLPLPQQATAPYGGQKLCPVTGDELGSMGAPIPVNVRGQTIWVCCRGCVAKVQRDPDKYLRKVEAERAGQQPKRP